MVPSISPLHASGPALPLATGRALATLGLGFVAFLAVCYLWYRDYRRMQRGDRS